MSANRLPCWRPALQHQGGSFLVPGRQHQLHAAVPGSARFVTGDDGGVKGRERRDCCAERDHGERVEITSGEQHIMLHMRLLFFRFIQKSRVATPT